MLSVGRPTSTSRAVALQAGERLLTGRRCGGQHDGRVGAAERLDLPDRILRRGVDRVRGTERLGDVELAVEHVDGGDGGAGDPRVLDGQVAESADAEHGDEI